VLPGWRSLAALPALYGRESLLYGPGAATRWYSAHIAMRLA
jgi:hypothetical protein